AEHVVGSDREQIWLQEQPYWFDVREFLRLTQPFAEPGQPQQPINETDILRLTEGIRLYHGDFLANFKQPPSHTFAAWLEQEQRYWHQRAVYGLMVLINHATRHSQLAKATAYVRRLLEIDPYHEEAHGWLMSLLAHQQQRTEAVEHYHRYAQLIQREPGGKVEPELSKLYQEIRNGGLPQLLVGEQHELAGVARVAPHWQTVPTPLTPLIGRAQLLAQLTHYLHTPSIRLLTLTGMGGVGKSRVALAVALAESTKASLFRDGVTYIPLEPPTNRGSAAGLSTQQSHALVTQAIAHALSFSSDMVNVPLERQIAAYLHQRQQLLIVDHFEAFIESTPFLLTLLEAATAVKLFVVSREVLQAPGELVVQMAGLPWRLDPEEDSPEEDNAEEDARGDTARGDPG
ncbi:MAG: hypothetical protein KDE47_26855, partial [Caldilineaceae bacterium]|nr:hypothetical protein [Caldilineaceae bacterium]